MRTIYLMLFLLSLPSWTDAQDRYITRQGFISFYSHTSVEDIEAVNNQVLSIVDLSNGAVAVSLLMKSFQFEKALMQEHFNENYIESDKYPKASFQGKIENLQSVLSGENGVAVVKGDLTVHGITKPITMEGKLGITDHLVKFEGKFMVTVSDFEIKIPSIVSRNIAKEVEVTCILEHERYK